MTTYLRNALLALLAIAFTVWAANQISVPVQGQTAVTSTTTSAAMAREASKANIVIRINNLLMFLMFLKEEH